MHCPNCGADLNGFESSTICPYCGTMSQVVLARALRLELFAGDTYLLLPKGTVLPATVSYTFSTGLNQQTSAQLHLLQGDEVQANANRSLGEFTFNDLVPRPRGIPRITFTFTVDGVGRLKAQGREEASGREQWFTGTQVEVIRQ